jgi:hypothetical protein
MTLKIETEAFSKRTMTVSIGDSPLASELNKITKFRNSDAPEIIAFYAGRIVEAMVSLAITKLNLPAGDGKVSTLLDILSTHGKIDEGTLSIAHAIRRYGNQVRHLERAIHSNEESTIIGLLQLWVEWFERVVFPSSSSTLESSANQWSDKTDLLRQLTYPKSGALDEHIQKLDQREALLTEAALAEFSAERAVDFRSQYADAFTAEVIARFPRSVRAKQMRALYYSRNGNPDGAINILSKFLNNHYRNPDRETFGILGGAYKNKWIETSNAIELSNADKYYKQGADFYPKDYYLRINLAATSLWKGELSQSRSHANSALQSLAESGFVINTGDKCDGFDYWIVATIAEANLLAGKAKRAAYLYEQARNLDSSGGRWNRTMQQLSLHLKYIDDQNTRQNFAALK